jgi:hypothetical protein
VLAPNKSEKGDTSRTIFIEPVDRPLLGVETCTYATGNCATVETNWQARKGI